LQLHAKVAFEEALQWGCFRTGGVRIGGTSHVPPPADELDERHRRGLSVIERIEHPFERALVYYFWGALHQFFFDGNERTSRAVTNFILLRAGYYYLSVPGERKDAFDLMMVDFYEGREATTGMSFLLDCYRSWD
jgi:Fic family protein